MVSSPSSIKGGGRGGGLLESRVTENIPDAPAPGLRQVTAVACGDDGLARIAAEREGRQDDVAERGFGVARRNDHGESGDLATLERSNMLNHQLVKVRYFEGRHDHLREAAERSAGERKTKGFRCEVHEADYRSPAAAWLGFSLSTWFYFRERFPDPFDIRIGPKPHTDAADFHQRRNRECSFRHVLLQSD